MLQTARHLTLRLATGTADRQAAGRLRYDVFVVERGGDGPLVDHAAGIERDRFDAHAEHLVLVDPGRPEGRHVVGVTRLIDETAAARAGQFYSEDEYDLAPLRASGRGLLELGRTCLEPGHRGGAALWQLWAGLARIVEARGIGLVFGTASFSGTDATRHAGAIALLGRDHLAPAAIRPRCLRPVPPDPAPVDALAAARQLPPLMKSYLRLGGRVGEGAYVDHAFNTVDMCMVLDVATMTPRARGLMQAGQGAGPRD